MNKRECFYEFYLYCNPNLFILEDDSIVDVNLVKSVTSKKIDSLEIETDDSFFIKKLSIIEEKDFSIVLQSFDKEEIFSQQLELFGEDFKIEDNKATFSFKSKSTNHVYPSINPFWKNAIELYKSERVSYIRNSKIEKLLF